MSTRLDVFSGTPQDLLVELGKHFGVSKLGAPTIDATVVAATVCEILLSDGGKKGEFVLGGFVKHGAALKPFLRSGSTGDKSRLKALLKAALDTL